jgi:HD-GYP domain-containing protein (c-di-GMP phosphodiesterase class II)
VPLPQTLARRARTVENRGFARIRMNAKLLEIPVGLLKFGMFVAALDRPWSETPFMFQGFVLRTETQLVALRKFCKHVYVDPVKEERVQAQHVAPAGPPQPSAEITEQLREKVRGDAVYRVSASVEAELPQAQSAYARADNLVARLSQTIMTSNVIETERAKEAVAQITDSVVRNPDAMMLLSQLREQAAKSLDRALQVSVHMTVFGRFLQLPRDRIELLGLVGLLQDVGTLKLPPGIAERRGALVGEARELYKTHITHTVEILSNTPGLPPEILAWASLHHERYDGSGYPRGLRGKAIAQFGSIAAIIDTFDALTAPPPYGEIMPPSTALNVLFQNRGTQFHAGLVEQYIQCVGAFPVGSVVELNSGEVAIVIAQNLTRRLQPRVMVVEDEDGNPVNPHKILNLIDEPHASTNEIYRIRRTLESDTVRINPRELFL